MSLVLFDCRISPLTFSGGAPTAAEDVVDRGRRLELEDRLRLLHVQDAAIGLDAEAHDISALDRHEGHARRHVARRGAGGDLGSVRGGEQGGGGGGAGHGDGCALNEASTAGLHGGASLTGTTVRGGCPPYRGAGALCPPGAGAVKAPGWTMQTWLAHYLPQRSRVGPVQDVSTQEARHAQDTRRVGRDR